MKIYGVAGEPRVYVHPHVTRPVTIAVAGTKLACSIAEARILARDLAEAADEAEQAAAHE